MTNAKKLGIFMDYSLAHLIEFTAENQKVETVTPKYANQKQALAKSENLMHNGEQHRQAEFYKALGEAMKNYEEVVLFGPTHAKVELYNSLKEDRKFDSIRIEVVQTDKMPIGEQQSFVRAHFSNRSGLIQNR